MGRWESVVLFALTALSTLLVWSPDALWNWASEGAMLLLAAVICMLGYGRVDYKMFIPIGAIGAWGFFQLAVGLTVVRYATLAASLQMAAYASVGFSAAAVLRLGERREKWLQWFCWFAVGIGLVSVLAYHTSAGKILWIFPTAYPDNWGPFPSRNNFAQFLELSFPVAVYQFDRVQRRASEARWLAGLAPAILFACGVASASRAGSIILVLEALCMAVLLRRSKGFAWAGTALATGALIFVMGAGTLAGRFRAPDPLSGRREIFRAAWKMALARPWTGYGLGTFPYVYPEYAEFDPGARVEHAHNDWLEWLTEGGIPFAATWILLTIFVARPALRSIWGVGILAVLVHALADYPFAKLGVAAWLFALIGGLFARKHGFLEKDYGAASKRRNEVKLRTVQSVVAVLVSLNLSIAKAATPPIGMAVTRGSFRVDNATVTGNATLVEGTTIETEQAGSSLELTGGTHIALGAQSKGRIFGDHILLEKGAGDLEKLTGYRVEARGLTIQPQSGAASARVALTGSRLVQVAALTGSFRVMNAKGLVVANLTPGSALEFDPQATGQGEPWKLSGCLVSAPGHFTLTDDTTNVRVEAVGMGLEKESGNKVEIAGAMDATATPVSGATQVIRVSQIKRLAKNCTPSNGKGTAAAPAAAGGSTGSARIARISTTTILILGGVAAGVAVGGLAAADKLPGQSAGSSR